LVGGYAVVSGAFAGIELRSLTPYVLAGVCAPAFSHLAMYRSIDRFGGTRTAVVLGLVPVLSAVAAWLILGETPGWWVGLGAVLVVLAGILVVDPRARSGDASTGPLLAILATVFFAGRDIFIRGASEPAPPVVGSATALTTAAVLLVAVNLVAYRTEVRAMIRGGARPLLVPGVLMGFGFTSLVAGLSIGKVAIVATMSATQSIWAVLFARLVLDRSEWSRQVLVAAVIAAAGGVAVTLGR
ncbi:MAG: DMT family transporter, partial [Acidimicrobiia bacterium]|nr:DMT family transporter [Acidimicrobiia bacterium]